MAAPNPGRLGPYRLPLHTRAISVLFREGSGWRVAVSGGTHAIGDIIAVLPGLRLQLKAYLGGSNPDPGEPQPREGLWLVVKEGQRLEEEIEAGPAKPAVSMRRLLQKAGVLPKGRRRRKPKLPA